MTKHLGIIGAMDEECVLFAKRFGGNTRSIGSRHFLTSSLGPKQLTVVRSGIGKVAAATTATLLIHQFNVDAVLFTGTAGGIHHDVGVGDLVVADGLVQHDFDLRGVLGFERFVIPQVGGPRLPVCPDLFVIARDSAAAVAADAQYKRAVSEFVSQLPRVHQGVIASGDTFICEEEEHRDLRASIPSLMCVEMEGAAVAQVCLEHGVPLAEARVISDCANGASKVDFPRFIKHAASVGSDLLVAEFVRRLVA